MSFYYAAVYVGYYLAYTNLWERNHILSQKIQSLI